MRLTINDIRYIIKESKKLLLTEISNNAIETLFKRYMPEYKHLLKTVEKLGKIPNFFFFVWSLARKLQ